MTHMRSAEQRRLLPFGAFDHYDTLILWTLCRETIGYRRGKAVNLGPVSAQSISDVVGLTKAPLSVRLARLESVGLIRRTPRGLLACIKEVDVAWPKVESD